jgi:hypothetical protein
LTLVQRLWLPGPFPTTNDLLDMQRAAGVYEGKRQAMRNGGFSVTAPPAFSFAAKTREIRNDANMQARAARLKPMSRAAVWVDWCGSGREDPDAWTLAAKAILDGLVDAKVFGSDRRNVESVGGRCAGSAEEIREVLMGAVSAGVPRRGGGGIGVLLTFNGVAA